MSFTPQLFTLPDGTRLPYVEQGDADGTPVVLIHGVTDSWRSYERVLPLLPRTLHTFALTLRGHGDADRPARGYRPRDLAADVASFLAARRLGSAVVVGHSLGCTVALHLASEYPHRVRGLVLAGAFASYTSNPVVLEFAREILPTLADPLDREFVQSFQNSTLAQPVDPDLLATVVDESLKVPLRIWQAAFAGMLGDNVLVDLEAVRVPTLLIWGDRDTMATRRDQAVLLGALSGARMVTYPGAGHALHWEDPARFARDVAAFAGAQRGGMRATG